MSRQGLTLGLRPLLVYKSRRGLLWGRQINYTLTVVKFKVSRALPARSDADTPPLVT